MLSESVLKQINDHLDFFNIRFENIKICKKPTSQFIAQYEHTYPEYLFYIWDKLGFASFENGGFWLVNPVDYEDILELCLKDTDFPKYDDFYVIARRAFGELFTVGTKTNSSIKVDITNLKIYPSIATNIAVEDNNGLRNVLSTIVVYGAKKILIFLIKMKNYFLIAV